MTAVYFIDDDAGYRRWLAEHPNGYVVNTYRNPSSGYMVLHRAMCPTISEYSEQRKPGGFTERGYSKACGETLGDLRRWVRANGRPDGSFTSEACRRCKP